MIALPLPVLLALAVPQDAGLARLEMKPVELSLSDGTTRTAFRGMLRVPIVRSKPDSKEIGVDVWRFPADEGVPEGTPPMFRLHGGPGWPGIDPEDIDWEDDVADVVRYGDLVIVGQRGIGKSDPDTSCAEYSAQPDPDASQEETVELIRERCAACRAHWEEQGYDLTGFNVLEAAMDVRDAARLLGYDKIVILGGSFGSHWGMTVLRFHPDLVERALLHGMEGPDHTYDSPSGVLGALERIAEDAQASEELAGLLPEEGLIEALRLVIRSLEKEALELDISDEVVRITAEDVRDVALGYTGRVNSRRTVGRWPGDVMRLYDGEFEALARTLFMRRRSGAGGRLPTASFFNLDCGSGITRERLKRYQEDPAVEIVGDLSFFYEAACPAWNSDLGDAFRADFKTSVPTLVVHGTWDVSTPFDNALELLECFEDLHFVPVSRGTHGALSEAFREIDGFRDAAMRFLFYGETEDLPEELELPPIDWVAAW